MSGLGDAVKNGPRATSARVAHIEARIEVHEARAKQAEEGAREYEARANRKGLFEEHWRMVAGAKRRTAAAEKDKANRLRVELAKAKEREAREEATRVKRTVARTSDHPGQPGQRPGQAKPAKPAKPARPTARPVAKPGRYTEPEPVFPKCIRCPHNLLQHNAKGCIKCKCDIRVTTTERPQAIPTTPTKGTTTVIGEASTLEQTKASLDELEERFQEDSAAVDGLSSGLSTRGLDNLSTSLARIQDAIDAAKPAFEDARDQLAKQEAIAEQARAAGEMADADFYEVG